MGTASSFLYHPILSVGRIIHQRARKEHPRYFLIGKCWRSKNGIDPQPLDKKRRRAADPRDRWIDARYELAASCRYISSQAMLLWQLTFFSGRESVDRDSSGRWLEPGLRVECGNSSAETCWLVWADRRRYEDWAREWFSLTQ